MLYAKTFRTHLLKGGTVEDWQDGEPGLCCNGGRYYIKYRLRNGILMFRSSYEDAEWEDAGQTIKEFSKWAHDHSNDKPNYITGSRFWFAK